MNRQFMKAFFLRDWQSARSYRMAAIMQVFGLFIPLIGLFFLNRMFDTVTIPALERFGGNYIAWMMVGVILATFSGMALGMITGPLRGAQIRGTLEPLLLTRASLPTVMVGWTVYPLTRAFIGMAIYFAGAFIIVGIAVSGANFAAAVLIVILMLLIMGSIGLLSASFTLVFKQSNPAIGVFFLASGFLSGTVYPLEVLPTFLRGVGRALPQTHAIEAMRLAILEGYRFQDMSTQFGVLLIYLAILFPLGVISLQAALRQAKIDGSLAHY